LAALADLPQLESLDLSGTPVWDLSPLKALSNLTSLFLVMSSVVDLTPLRGLKKLTLLDISLTKVQRWSHLVRQPAKVDSPMQRMIHHEDAETVFG
jgi:Leucine-rich repeat (LRR) protein